MSQAVVNKTAVPNKKVFYIDKWRHDEGDMWCISNSRLSGVCGSGEDESMLLHHWNAGSLIQTHCPQNAH